MDSHSFPRKRHSLPAPRQRLQPRPRSTGASDTTVQGLRRYPQPEQERDCPEFRQIGRDVRLITSDLNTPTLCSSIEWWDHFNGLDRSPHRSKQDDAVGNAATLSPGFARHVSLEFICVWRYRSRDVEILLANVAIPGRNDEHCVTTAAANDRRHASRGSAIFRPRNES